MNQPEAIARYAQFRGLHPPGPIPRLASASDPILEVFCQLEIDAERLKRALTPLQVLEALEGGFSPRAAYQLALWFERTLPDSTGIYPLKSRVEQVLAALDTEVANR